ncbi:MAG TPA: ester cyclase [Kofleriaceae bacterium]|nr:ester cyclase [Kofleriaceae bacterium]
MRVVLLALLVACGGKGDSEPASQPIPANDAAAKPVAVARPLDARELVAHLRECDKQFAARADDALAACYAPTATAALVGGAISATTNQQVVDQLARGLWVGFPDLQVAPQLQVAAGTAVVSVDLLTGNNRGAFLGQPATQRPIGVIAARLLQMLPTGEIADEQLFVDEATLRGQLGDPALLVRPLIPTGLAEPRVVVAAGTPAERATAALLGKVDVAINDHADKALLASFATDAVVVDHTAAQDARGQVAIGQYYQQLFHAFPDLHTTRIALWAAGPIAVQVVELIGTNEGPWPALAIRKPTHHTVRLRQLQVAETRGQGLASLWTFANGLSLRIQLGLIPDPSTAAPEDSDPEP